MQGSSYILLPELCLSGYGCQDHFLEIDTCIHSWDCINEILPHTKPEQSLSDILIDVGMPVIHKDVIYNCRIILMNGSILLIRPKLVLANGGLHRESRWFTPWSDFYYLDQFTLPLSTQQIQNGCQKTVPFGNAIIKLKPANIVIGFETCEELWSTKPPHITLFLNGAHIVANASASHHELRKFSRRIRLVENASSQGLYMYSNLRGSDSERICYDGGALIALAGKIINCSRQFSYNDVEVISTDLDLSQLESMRISNKTFGLTASALHSESKLQTIEVPFNLMQARRSKQVANKLTLLSPMEEIAQGPGLWLWDHLRRSNQSGFFLCLSGGIDSCSVALIIFNMCKQLLKSVNEEKHENTKTSLQRILRSEKIPESPQELCQKLLVTCYMGTKNNSNNTLQIAKNIAAGIGSEHHE
ncbi:glutamine-dependent NAD(+) synthetase, partial [Cichlidogyrus casuarinus]